jgi:hypothetical protein
MQLSRSLRRVFKFFAALLVFGAVRLSPLIASDGGHSPAAASPGTNSPGAHAPEVNPSLRQSAHLISNQPGLVAVGVRAGDELAGRTV